MSATRAPAPRAGSNAGERLQWATFVVAGAVAGPAIDSCVAWTALDARKAGFEAHVIEDATRAIDLDGSLAAAWRQMAAKGVGRIRSTDIADA